MVKAEGVDEEVEEVLIRYYDADESTYVFRENSMRRRFIDCVEEQNCLTILTTHYSFWK